jgi:hypothetical protein
MLVIAQDEALSQLFQPGLRSYMDLEHLGKMRFVLGEILSGGPPRSKPVNPSS